MTITRTIGASGGDDTDRLQAAIDEVKVLHGRLVLPDAEYHAAGLTIDDAMDLVGANGYGTRVVAPSGATGPILTVAKSGSSQAVREGHLCGVQVVNLRLDGNARQEDVDGLRLAQLTNSRFENVQIRHCARRGLWLDLTVHETSFDHCHVRACGDLAAGHAAVDLNHSSTLDAHNNLYFDHLFVNYPYGVGIQMASGSGAASRVRNVFFAGLMVHGVTDTVQNDDLLIEPDWRHNGAPLIDIADGRYIHFVGGRLHASGAGQPLLLMRTNPDSPATHNSVAMSHLAMGEVAAGVHTFAADPSNDTLAAVGSKLGDRALVRVSTDGTLPAGLAAGTDYYVIRINDDSVKLSATRTGGAVDVTDAGSGAHTLTCQQVGVLGEQVRGLTMSHIQHTADLNRACVLAQTSGRETFGIMPTFATQTVVEDLA